MERAKLFALHIRRIKRLAKKLRDLSLEADDLGLVLQNGGLVGNMLAGIADDCEAHLPMQDGSK